MFKHIKKDIRNIKIISILFVFYILSNNISNIIKLLKGILILIILSSMSYYIIRNLYYRIKYKHRVYTIFEIKNKIINMNPREFEIFCTNLFNGIPEYKGAKTTDFTCDGGKDIIMTNMSNKHVYVECKHYRPGNLVGRPMIQKLIGACIGDEVKNAIFITTSNYTNEAIEYANKIPWLEIWTMKDIVREVNRIEQSKIGLVLNCLKE